eukprot:GHVU01208743.1.p1 GENE.GHVU01208743.1~~GHVU01208743.1.p1  ORF type:complete len:239 (-),score=14.37 GHVU01208743.1:495-1211(-)
MKDKSNKDKSNKDRLNIGYHPIYEHIYDWGYYIDKAPKNVLDELKLQVDNLQKDFSKGIKYNDRLAGEIKHEYKLKLLSNTNEYLRQLTSKYNSYTKVIDKYFKGEKFGVDEDLWINFQKKHEYNPTHTHTGIISFVIWYQIPYSLEDETRFSSQIPSKSSHGRFNFLTPFPNQQFTVKDYNLDIDKNYNGYIAMFPSLLAHNVYPFYSSNNYRITISGNIISKDREITSYYPQVLWK